jgi:hypothetical protein
MVDSSVDIESNVDAGALARACEHPAEGGRVHVYIQRTS